MQFAIPRLGSAIAAILLSFVALQPVPCAAQSDATVTLTADPNPARAGVPVFFTVQVQTPSGPGVGLAGLCIMPVGSDYCGVGSKPLDSNGILTVSQPFSAGSYYVTAEFLPSVGTTVSSKRLVLVVTNATVPALGFRGLIVLVVALSALALHALRKGSGG